MLPPHRTRGQFGLLLALGILAGCKTYQPPPPQLNIWHSLPSADARVLTELAAPLKQDHPDWEMTIAAMPPETIAARLGTPEGPDAALVPLAGLATLIHEHRVLPLEAHLSERDRLDFLPAAWRHVTVDGHTWAVPMELSCLGLLYRKSMLDAAEIGVPPTLTDMMLQGTAFHKKDPQHAFLSLPTDPYTLMPMLWANGGKLEQDDQWRATTRYLLTLRSRQVIGPFHQTQESCVDVLAAGRAAMAIGSPENLPQVESLSTRDDLGVAPVPNSSDSGHTPMVGRVWVISPKADRLDAALTAVAALSSKESAARWNARLSRLPARLSAYDSPLIRRRPALGLFKEHLGNARVLSESDLAAIASLAPQWRPYLTGQKKLEMPKAPVSGKGIAPAATNQQAIGSRRHTAHNGQR